MNQFFETVLLRKNIEKKSLHMKNSHFFPSKPFFIPFHFIKFYLNDIEKHEKIDLISLEYWKDMIPQRKRMRSEKTIEESRKSFSEINEWTFIFF